MTDVRDATNTLLTDRPDLEDEIRALLAVDAEHETWTFGEIPLDSGTFGELVSRGIVEKRDGEYRLADREAVQAALGNEAETPGASPRFSAVSLTLPSRQTTLPLVSAFALVAIFRLLAFPSVFRGEHVVLLANDPYYYRYWLFDLLNGGAGITSLPTAVRTGEPLLFATLLAATKLFGGTQAAASLVLAWYPVVAGLVTAGLAYVLTIQLTDDRRVGLAALVLLAVTPVHAYRTAVGFADHHGFDYIWLSLTVVAAIGVLRSQPSLPLSHRLRTPRVWGWIGIFGVAVAAQVLAWNAGPLHLLPLALYGVGRTAAAVGGGESPLADVPLVIGVAFGALLALGAHLTLDWQTFAIVVPPFLLALGLSSVLGVGALTRRLDVSAIGTFGALLATGGLVFAVVYLSLPEFAAEVTDELGRIVNAGRVEGIAETRSLFSAGYGTITGPFFFYGLNLFVSLPYIAWSVYTGWAQNRPAWLLAGSYSALFLVLATLQVRFAGQLALLAAPFTGLGFVHLAAATDVLEQPAVFSGTDGPRRPRGNDRGSESTWTIPSKRTIKALVLLFIFVGGLGSVMTPLRTNLLTVSDESYRAAVWMEEHSRSEEWEYPQNYVFSQWSHNRMYNAFVNGRSRSYDYAVSNYDKFLSSADALTWYQQLHDRTGFVVVDRGYGPANASDEHVYTRLQRGWGSGTGHYRAVWASEDASKKIYVLVRGAVITGRAPPGTTVTVTHGETVSGQAFTYRRTVRTAPNGTYAIRVQYAGTYAVNGERVSVPETAVDNGSRVATPPT